MPVIQQPDTLSSQRPLSLKLFDGERLAAEGVLFWLSSESDTDTSEMKSFKTVQGSEVGSSQQWLPMIEAVEARLIKVVILQHGGNLTRAAQALGTTRDELVERLKQLGLD